jgi:hypothetical protein
VNEKEHRSLRAGEEVNRGERGLWVVSCEMERVNGEEVTIG